MSASSGINKAGLLKGNVWQRAMNEDDMAQVAEEFAAAARLCREAGFDAVELHMGHGYLLNQFISPLSNKRSDKYGGALDYLTETPQLCNRFCSAARIISEGPTLLASRRFQREILLTGRSCQHFLRSLTVIGDQIDENRQKSDRSDFLARRGHTSPSSSVVSTRRVAGVRLVAFGATPCPPPPVRADRPCAWAPIGPRRAATTAANPREYRGGLLHSARAGSRSPARSTNAG